MDFYYLGVERNFLGCAGTFWLDFRFATCYILTWFRDWEKEENNDRPDAENTCGVRPSLRNFTFHDLHDVIRWQFFRFVFLYKPMDCLAQLNRRFMCPTVEDKNGWTRKKKEKRERTRARTLFLLRRNIWKRFDRLNESRERTCRKWWWWLSKRTSSSSFFFFQRSKIHQPHKINIFPPCPNEWVTQIQLGGGKKPQQQQQQHLSSLLWIFVLAIHTHTGEKRP